MLTKLCHLDNNNNNNDDDLEIIIILQLCILRSSPSTHDLHTLPGDIFFSRYPSLALPRNEKSLLWDFSSARGH